MNFNVNKIILSNLNLILSNSSENVIRVKIDSSLKYLKIYTISGIYSSLLNCIVIGLQIVHIGAAIITNLDL